MLRHEIDKIVKMTKGSTILCHPLRAGDLNVEIKLRGQRYDNWVACVPLESAPNGMYPLTTSVRMT